MRSHVNHDTSAGKSEQSAAIVAFFNPNGRRRDGFRFTLVGTSAGLLRHIREHKIEGFREEKMVVVERDRKTFLALQQESARIKFKGIVVFGDFNAVVRRYATEGKRIAHLDFDGVENFNRNGFAEKFFALVNEVNAESYAYTFQPRGKADAETETLCRSLGMEKKACKKSNGVVDNSLDQGKIRAPRYRVKELAEIFTSRILPSWQHSEVQGYRGCRTAKNNRNDGGCSMQFILGKRWTNENAPFEDAGL